MLKSNGYIPKLFSGLFDLYLWVVVVAVIFLTSIQMRGFADDPGLGWHLKTGEWISSKWRVPEIDPFLASSTPRSWVCDQWLSDLVFSRAFGIGGWPLLYAICCSIFLLTFFFIQYRGLRKLSGSVLSSALVSFVAMKLATIHFILRPVIFSFLLFAIVYFECIKIFRARNNLGGNGNSALSGFGPTYVTLPLLFILWANLHPSFILGITLLGMLAVTSVVDRFFCGETAISPKFVERVLILGFLCLAATAINPNGIALHKSILWLSQNSYFLNLNSEWKPLDLESPEGQLFVGTIFLVFSLLYVVGRKSVEVGSFQLFSLFGFSYASLSSVRFLPYYGMVLAPTLAVLLVQLGGTHFFSTYSGAKKIRAFFTEWEAMIKDSKLGSLVLFGFILISLCAQLWGGGMPLYRGEYGPSKKLYPYAAMEYLLTLPGIGDASDTILNHPNWGGFIIFEGAGNLRPLIDDRNTLLGERPYRDFLERLKPESDWKEYIQALHPKYILLPKDHSIISSLNSSSEFRSVYRDDISELFVLD